MNQPGPKCSLVTLIQLAAANQQNRRIWILSIDGRSADDYWRTHLACESTTSLDKAFIEQLDQPVARDPSRGGADGPICLPYGETSIRESKCDRAS